MFQLYSTIPTNNVYSNPVNVLYRQSFSDLIDGREKELNSMYLIIPYHTNLIKFTYSVAVINMSVICS